MKQTRYTIWQLFWLTTFVACCFALSIDVLVPLLAGLFFIQILILPLRIIRLPLKRFTQPDKPNIRLMIYEKVAAVNLWIFVAMLGISISLLVKTTAIYLS